MIKKSNIPLLLFTIFVSGHVFAGDTPSNNEIAEQRNAISTLKLPGENERYNQQISNMGTADFLKQVQVSSQPLGRLPDNSQKKTEEKKPYDLFVFVSSSMPAEALKSYSKQAKKLGAILVLRGFVNDKSSETRKFVAEMNEGGAEWMIHPESFTVFKVESVPSIVLADATSKTLTESGCAIETSYSKLLGNISLYAALDKFSLNSSKFSKIAKNIISESKITIN